MAAAPKWCQSDVTQESRHRARAVPQHHAATSQGHKSHPDQCHRGAVTSQGQSHQALGSQLQAAAGADGSTGTPASRQTQHMPHSRAGQHIWTLGQQFVDINQSCSLSVPRCCSSSALWGWGRDSSALGLATAMPGTHHHPAHPRPHASVGSAWKQAVPRDTKPELASQAVSIPAEHLYLSS